MRKTGETGNCKVWLSARDTYDWAHRPGASWPCSTLSDHRIMAEVQGDNLVDFTIDGKMGDCDGNELDAILADFGARGAR
jgi:hypothetical protein